MAIELKMPALSPTMEEGKIAKWLVKEGDEVKSGDLLAEIETDKATMEFEAVDEGRIGKIVVPEGSDNVKVGTVIALIDGYALGGGAELAYACDFRIGTPTTKIGNPEPGLGILAAAGAAWRLRELVGEPLANEVLLAGRVLEADEALGVRLLNEVVGADDLEAAGHRLADRITKQAPLATRLTKSALLAPREAHPVFDNVAQAVLFETQDKHDRMTAFLDRRKEK